MNRIKFKPEAQDKQVLTRTVDIARVRDVLCRNGAALD